MYIYIYIYIYTHTYIHIMSYIARIGRARPSGPLTSRSKLLCNISNSFRDNRSYCIDEPIDATTAPSLSQSSNSSEETPNPRRDSEKLGDNTHQRQ